MEITLSIVGTAGRKEDAKQLTLSYYNAMYVVADGLITQLNDTNYLITHLVSGGAAWADHIAVKLFLNKKVSRLRLFLPAEWEGGSYKDNGVCDSFKNPGGTANYYHRKFHYATHINSLSEIQVASLQGAELIPVAKGFYARNALVAKSDFILACTFGNGAEVKEGGTADTIRKYLARVKKEGFFDKSFHFCLTDGKIYEGCKIPSKEIDKLPTGLSTRINLNRLQLNKHP